MQQVLVNTPPTISETWYEDGVVADPGTVTATITRADGTVLVSAAPTSGSGVGPRSLALTGYTSQLGRLTVEWVSPTLGTLTSTVEIVGGFYFSVAEFLAHYADDTEAQALSASEIAQARATAEEIIEGLNTEDGCHVAFVPRAETFRLSGDGRTRLSIPRYKVRSVLSCTVDGVTVDPGLLSIESSSIYRSSWTRGFSNVVLEVTHGYDEPPARIKDAAMLLAYHRVVKGPIDDRATGRLTPEGSVLTLSTPGLRGSVTGIPEVDAAIQQHRLPRIVPVSVSLTDRGNAFPPLPIW